MHMRQAEGPGSVKRPEESDDQMLLGARRLLGSDLSGPLKDDTLS